MWVIQYLLMIYYMGYYNNNATGDRKGTAPKKEIGKKLLRLLVSKYCLPKTKPWSISYQYSEEY